MGSTKETGWSQPKGAVCCTQQRWKSEPSEPFVTLSTPVPRPQPCSLSPASSSSSQHLTTGIPFSPVCRAAEPSVGECFWHKQEALGSNPQHSVHGQVQHHLSVTASWG